MLRSKLFVSKALRISGRVRHEATAGVTKATLYIKERVELGLHTALNAKLELHARAKLGVPGEALLSSGARDVQARVELSHKMLNVTDSQDCRLRIGCDLLAQTAYAEARENHLSLKLACPLRGGKVSWSCLYDL